MENSAIEKEKPMNSLMLFFENFTNFSDELGKKLVSNFDKEQIEDADLAAIYAKGLLTASESVGTELRIVLKTTDNETNSLLARHINNTGINEILETVTEKLKLGKFANILGKISAILELIKKLLTQILDKLEKWGVPKFIRKILGIILDLLQFIDNILPRLLDLFGIKSEGISKDFLASAEEHFLSTHKSWRELHYNYNTD
ncbi:MAG: hypothetical protein K2X95_00120 [Flavobacteriaceae bacterium]|nr:hypothetical protein [Flavobacteriaceae bacterium]